MNQERIAEILKSDLSDGAKVAAIAIEMGAKNIREIAVATNRPVRTAERHYANLRSNRTANLRQAYANLRVPTTQNCGIEDDPSRARIESTLRVDTYSKKEVEDSVAKAPATAPSAPEALQGSKYAFEGRVIKLLPRDFARWQKAYPAIPNLLAALETADVYFSEDPSGGAWFFRAAAWLQRENTKATAAAKPNWHEEKRRRDAEFLRLARGEAVQ